jgi:hypothetical protein
MLTDDDLRRELTAAFHEQADPIARTAIEPAALFGQAIRYRRRRAAAGTGSVMAAAAAITLVTTRPCGRRQDRSPWPARSACCSPPR